MSSPWERPARTQRRPHVLRLAALSGLAVAALDRAVAWSFAGTSPKPGPKTARHAKLGDGSDNPWRSPPKSKYVNYDKLKDEGSWMESFINGIGDLFVKKPPEEEVRKKKEEMAARLKENQEQLERFQGLKLGTVVGTTADGEPQRQAIPTKVLMGDAGQNLLVFAAADPKALQDTLLSLRLEAKQFGEQNVLVVPVLFDSAERTYAPLPKALFAQKTMSLPFVAVPAADDDAATEAAWGAFLAVEFAAAAKQGVGEQAEKEGLSVLLAASGEVVRRGLGFPIWEQVFQDFRKATEKAAKKMAADKRKAAAYRAEMERRASQAANKKGERIV